MKTLLIALAGGLALTSAALAAPAKTADSAIGPVLAAEANGMTLYTFRQDAAGVSNCYDGCAASWPPFLAASSARAEAGFDLVTRRDGTLQWTDAAGMPLYFWAGDAAPGDATGDGVGGVWDVARP